jgi:hypothetical protein
MGTHVSCYKGQKVYLSIDEMMRHIVDKNMYNKYSKWGNFLIFPFVTQKNYTKKPQNPYGF